MNRWQLNFGWVVGPKLLGSCKAFWGLLCPRMLCSFAFWGMLQTLWPNKWVAVAKLKNRRARWIYGDSSSGSLCYVFLLNVQFRDRLVYKLVSNRNNIFFEMDKLMMKSGLNQLAQPTLEVCCGLFSASFPFKLVQFLLTHLIC